MAIFHSHVNQRIKFMQVNGAVCLYKSLRSGSFAKQPNNTSKRSNTRAHRGKYWRLQKIKYAKLGDVQYVQCPSSNTTTELPWTTEQLWVSIRSNITWNHPYKFLLLLRSHRPPLGACRLRCSQRQTAASGKRRRCRRLEDQVRDGRLIIWSPYVPMVSRCPSSSFMIWLAVTISLAISGTDLLEVPIPCIRPIFQAYVREYPHKIWPKIWYVYVPPF